VDGEESQAVPRDQGEGVVGLGCGGRISEDRVEQSIGDVLVVLSTSTHLVVEVVVDFILSEVRGKGCQFTMALLKTLI